jgi:hypothetical protein
MIIAYSENGVSKHREASSEEAAFILEAQEEAREARAKEATAATHKAEAKALLLARLGINADEAALLLS